MKRNIKKKVMAGSMAVVMAAGLAGTYSYQNGASEVHAEEETKELTEAAENVLGDSDALAQGEFCKEESVYVKADASGKISETTVTEWLKNPAKGDVEDTSELNDIKNIKGDEAFAEGSGGELNWQSEGDDIYYQGTTDKELPVDVKVSYKLDGKEISPEDLEGKDGKVEIRFDYENKSKETVEVNGENVEMYTPFTMVTAMMLPTDEYKNVSIDNGKIISDADKDIVVGVAFPGLEENLDLEELDVDIPDSVTITADVKDVSVGPTITLASAEIMSEFNLDDVDSFDDLEDSINQLEDAADQLVDGSQAASDGAAQLADGSKTLADGVNTLNDKSGDLTSGVNTLADGVGAYTGGVAELANGSQALYEGATKLASGASALQMGLEVGEDQSGGAKAGAEALVGGLTTATEGVKAISSNLGTVSGALDEAGGLLGKYAFDEATQNQIASGVAAQVSANVSDEAASKIAEQIVNNMKFPEGTSEETIQTYKELAMQAAKAGASAAAEPAAQEAAKAAVGATIEQQSQITVGLQQYIGGAKGGVDTIKGKIDAPYSEQGLAESMAVLTAGADSLKGGIDQLASGSETLAAGTASLAENMGTLAAGAAKLQENSAPLMAGVTALKEGGSQLAGGVGQLADGAAQVSDGANALAEGNQQLAEGMSEFKSEGIDKLTETFNGDIQNAIDRIDAMSNLAKNYKSFAGIKDGVSGKTKFIIETEGVD